MYGGAAHELIVGTPRGAGSWVEPRLGEIFLPCLSRRRLPFPLSSRTLVITKYIKAISTQSKSFLGRVGAGYLFAGSVR